MLPEALKPLLLPRGVSLPARAPARPASVRDPLPRLTVVTPSYNQAAYLETTIRSVLSQGYPALEYFVIDGGSSDASRSIIEHYAPRLSGWVSERDRGQVDAILKGLDRATGDWFIWINSDDVLAPGALWKVAAAIQHDEVDLIGGVTRQFDENGSRGAVVCRQLDVRSLILEQLPSGCRWHQPAIWMRREAMIASGIDTRSHFRFDYALLIRYLHRFPRVRYLDDTLAYFRFHSESKTVSTGPRFRDEHLDVLARLARDPAFADYAADLSLGHRAVAWLQQVDALLADRARPRFQRLAELLRGVRADPDARWTRNTRRAARRIALKGGR